VIDDALSNLAGARGAYRLAIARHGRHSADAVEARQQYMGAVRDLERIAQQDSRGRHAAS
jgi:hypothetical protein